MTLRTRALAAEAVRLAARATRGDAATSVTDGTQDNGIDALHVDLSDSILTLVQAKWHTSGNGTIGVGDTHAFIQGFKDLTDESFDRFNSKIQGQQSNIAEALNSTDLAIHMVVVTSGGDELAPEVELLFADLLQEMNQDGEMLTVSVWGIEYLRARLAHETAGARVDLKNVPIENYGSLSERAAVILASPAGLYPPGRMAKATAVVFAVAIVLMAPAGAFDAIFGTSWSVVHLATVTAVVAIWMIEALPAQPRAKRDQRAMRDLAKVLRAGGHTGPIAWAAGAVSGDVHDGVVLGRMVLGYVDAHGIGLVVSARTDQLTRAYTRLGFIAPDPRSPHLLIRYPKALVSRLP